MLTTTHKKGLVGKHLYSKAAREEGLNEGIRAMFSAGLGGALMKVGFNTLDPFEISNSCHIRLSLVTLFEDITGIMFIYMYKDGNPLNLHFVMFIPTLAGQGTMEQVLECTCTDMIFGKLGLF